MKELKDITTADIIKKIAEKREVLREFRFGGAGSKTKNVKLGHTTKKEIARMMTELSLRSHTK